MRVRQKREGEKGRQWVCLTIDRIAGGTPGVKLLTRARTAVSSVWELHQGNGKQRFHYGPRCIVGRERQGNFGEMKAKGEKKNRKYNSYYALFIYIVI